MVRIAPTPSGFLHAGNAANFAANALLAAEEVPYRLLLRIDDLDRQRFRMEYLEDIFQVIDWLGLHVTDGPNDPQDFLDNWSQETRMPLYRQALDQLRQHPLVFACPCSRKDLADNIHAYDCPDAAISLDQKGVSWRINTRNLAQHETTPDFVIRKKDGRPSYQLACTVDDLHFGITRCARGVDLLPSTAAQALLSDLLAYPPLFERIQFLHHPLLTDPAGSKLSKSAGAQGVSELRASGLTPEEIFGIARGWL